jgi:hypothetical protein
MKKNMNDTFKAAGIKPAKPEQRNPVTGDQAGKGGAV